MREGGRLKERERERRGRETDVPKLYTYNEYEHSVDSTFSDHSAWKENNFVNMDVNNIQYVITYDSDGKV